MDDNASIPQPVPSEPYSLIGMSWDAVERARNAQRVFSLRHLSDDELTAEHSELEDEWRLYQGDLACGDFTHCPEAIMRSGLAYLEQQLQDVTREMQRRARANVQREDASQPIDWQARFDAMRRVDIVEALATVGQPLRKRGREWSGPCPFHEDRTPSLSVSQQKGVWVCFSCRKGGDLVAYVALSNSCSRVDALSMLEKMVTV